MISFSPTEIISQVQSQISFFEPHKSDWPKQKETIHETKSHALERTYSAFKKHCNNSLYCWQTLSVLVLNCPESFCTSLTIEFFHFNVLRQNTDLATLRNTMTYTQLSRCLTLTSINTVRKQVERCLLTKRTKKAKQCWNKLGPFIIVSIQVCLFHMDIS